MIGTSIERSLYLTTQLLELDCKVIVALNMADILEQKGLKVDEKVLSEHIGVPVCRISALKSIGIDNLIKKIYEAEQKRFRPIYSQDIESAIFDIENAIPKEENNKRFIAVKLLEQDFRFNNLRNFKIDQAVKFASKRHNIELEEVIIGQRYDFISATTKKVITKNKTYSLTDKLDKVFLNKWLAIPIFIIIMFCIYYLSVRSNR